MLFTFVKLDISENVKWHFWEKQFMKISFAKPLTVLLQSISDQLEQSLHGSGNWNDANM